MANQAKVHIRPDGSLGTCEAEYQCRYAREDPRGPHFDTFEEAAMWLETEAEALEDCKMLVEPGDLENIVVNDDDSTTSRFKLRLW